MGKFHVFERFKGVTERGEKWDDITWDVLKPTYMTDNVVGWLLKCDFRMPFMGTLFLPHPTDDKQSLELEYNLPKLKIPNYKLGNLPQPEKNFTPGLKADWDVLPAEQTLTLGKMSLICKKDILDAMQHSIDGFLYVYRPVEMQVILKS